MPDELTSLQRELVADVLTQPRTSLRWYSHRHPNKDVAGRGEVRGAAVTCGRHWKGGLIAGYTVRQLVNRGALSPIDDENAKPFSAGGKPFRDYHLNPRNT